MPTHLRKSHWISAVAACLVALTAAMFAFSREGSQEGRHPPHKSEPPAAAAPERVRVEVAEPKPGGLERTTNQPGSVISFESADLYAKVSGYLKTQPVDIGSVVRRGDVLAVIDAPELFKDLDHAKAELEQAAAQIAQTKARVLTADADREAAAAAVHQAEAEIEKATAFRAFREKQYQRIKSLYEVKSIDARLVDEKQDEMESAQAAERVAQAGALTAEAQLTAAKAKVEQAKSDVANAEAQYRVAQSDVEKRQVYVDFTRIISPYNGVITKRNFFAGAFIRAADQGGNVPLLNVERIDVMRVVVEVPDRDVPYTNVGDRAKIIIDAQPGVVFESKVARIADAEDPLTRTMRVEIDLDNDKGLLREGMYGRATIYLDAGNKGVNVPSSALSGESEKGIGALFVVRDGVAKLVRARVGSDDGIRVEILDGLTTADRVIVRHNGPIIDGSLVEASGETAAASK